MPLEILELHLRFPGPAGTVTANFGLGGARNGGAAGAGGTGFNNGGTGGT